MNNKRSKFDVPAENECLTCEGTGMSRATTSQLGGLGSGCETCHGTGRLDEIAELHERLMAETYDQDIVGRAHFSHNRG